MWLNRMECNDACMCARLSPFVLVCVCVFVLLLLFSLKNITVHLTSCLIFFFFLSCTFHPYYNKHISEINTIRIHAQLHPSAQNLGTATAASKTRRKSYSSSRSSTHLLVCKNSMRFIYKRFENEAL